MKYAHILAPFYFEPWNLRPDYHANFGRILQAAQRGEPIPEAVFPRRLAPPAAQIRTTERPVVGPLYPFTGEPLVPQMEVAGGVALITAQGVLGRHLALVDLLCGACDYDHLSEFARRPFRAHPALPSEKGAD